VATATASGLAGILLFCGGLVDRAGIHPYRVKPKDKYINKVLKDTNMEQMLDKMCIGRTKFIAVEETLEQRFNQWLMKPETEGNAFGRFVVQFAASEDEGLGEDGVG